MAIDRNEIRELAGFYRRYMTDDIMAFWTARTADADHPGYLHLFDREGKLASTDKYVWCQGRQTYMFAELYTNFEQRDDWLALARRGRDLLVNHAHAGGGRFHYKLNRDGSVSEPHRSFFTDCFALSGLCAYATASGSDEDLPLIRETFDRIEQNLNDPDFVEFHHFSLDPALRYHGPRMISVGMAPLVRAVLGAQRVDPFAQQCLDAVLWEFAKDEHRVLFEVLGRDGSVLDTNAGRTINPGHALESMWFCLEEAMYRGDQRSIDRAVQITRWAYDNGLDREQGGVLAFTAPEGGMPPGGDSPNFIGESWDTKIWWVHSEAVYVLALAALVSGDETFWRDFLAQHDYWQRAFADTHYGEWYSYLMRDGTPRDTSKGSWVKSAFHIPRALMKLTLLLEKHAAR